MKSELSAELITTIFKALTHANTLLPHFQSARVEVNFTMQIARRASLKLNVDVKYIKRSQTHAHPAQTRNNLVLVDNSSTTLGEEFVRTSSSVMQTNT